MLHRTDFKIKKRIIVLLICITLVFLGFIGKFFWIQIVKNDKYKDIAISQRLRQLKVEPRRGVIFDRNGNQLAVSATAETVVAIPKDIKNPKKLARDLEKILNMDYDIIYERLISNVSAKYIKRKVSSEMVKKIKALEVDGIVFKDESKRYYPKDDLASHILGFSGIDNQGLEGIELSYDKYLQGVSGKISVERDAAGRTLPESIKEYVPPVKGYNIHLTIDEVIQYIVERELNKAMENFTISGGTAIVMNPDKGSILAMANTPDYNPNNFADFPQKNWRNKAISDSFEPGSTFKIITTASALEEGVVSEGDSFYCSGHVTVSGERIHCWKFGGHGQQTFSDVVKNSCNPGFVQVGMRMGKEDFYDHIKGFGFGEETGIKLPGEADGLVYNYDEIGPVELATMSFGHGITVTPIQLITAVSAVANGGMLVEPRLVEKVTDENGDIIKEIKTTPIRQVITEKTAERTRRLLKRVVAEGTGKNAAIDGFSIGGKTGTAKHYNKNIYDSSFIGIVPAEDPQFVILVVLYDITGQPYYGSQTAAPVFRNITLDTLRYLDVAPSFDDNKKDNDDLKIDIPDVVNKETNQAEKLLRKKGFDVKLIGMGDRVLKQVPVAGANMNKDSTVIIFLDESSMNNKGYYIAVPDLKGMEITEAEKILARLGLKIVVNGPGGNKIIKQNISPGERIEAGSSIVVKTEEK